MSDHWMGERVTVVSRQRSNFEFAFSAAIRSSDDMSIEIAGVRLRCDSTFASSLDSELIVMHLSPFDGPPPSEFVTSRGRRLGRKAFLRALLGA